MMAASMALGYLRTGPAVTPPVASALIERSGLSEIRPHETLPEIGGGGDVGPIGIEAVLYRQAVDDGDHEHGEGPQLLLRGQVGRVQAAQHGIAVPVVERRDALAQVVIAQGVRQHLEERLVGLGVSGYARLAVDERVDALLPPGQLARVLDEAAVGVVGERVDQRRNETGLVAEVIADAGLRLAGLPRDGRQLQRLEAAARQQTLGGGQQALRRRRQRLHGVLEKEWLGEPLAAGQAHALLVHRVHFTPVSPVVGRGLPACVVVASIHLSVRTDKHRRQAAALSAPKPVSRLSRRRRAVQTPDRPAGGTTLGTTLPALKKYRGRHFLTDFDYTREELEDLLRLAVDLKALWQKRPLTPFLPGQHLAMIFEAASTRTRVSFENGFAELGGNALYLRPGEIHLPGRESIADTARTLSQYNSAIEIRSKKNETVNELAEWSTVPVINGMDHDRHPCQSMSDALTVLEHAGTLAGVTFAYVGDAAHPCNSPLDHAHQAGSQRAHRQRRGLRDGPRAGRAGRRVRRRERRLVPAHQRTAGGHRRRRLQLQRLLVVDRPGRRVQGSHRRLPAVPGQQGVLGPHEARRPVHALPAGHALSLIHISEPT